MPLYEYKCFKCGRLTEKIEPVSGPHLRKCPHCAGKVEALISAPAIQFKGSGWYVTDYAGKKSAGGDSGKDDRPASDKKDEALNDSSKDSGNKDTSAKDTKEKRDTKEKKSEKSSSKK